MEGDWEPPTWISARVPWLCWPYEALHCHGAEWPHRWDCLVVSIWSLGDGCQQMNNTSLLLFRHLHFTVSLLTMQMTALDNWCMLLLAFSHMTYTSDPLAVGSELLHSCRNHSLLHTQRYFHWFVHCRLRLVSFWTPPACFFFNAPYTLKLENEFAELAVRMGGHKVWIKSQLDGE